MYSSIVYNNKSYSYTDHNVLRMPYHMHIYVNNQNLSRKREGKTSVQENPCMHPHLIFSAHAKVKSSTHHTRMRVERGTHMISNVKGHVRDKYSSLIVD